MTLLLPLLGGSILGIVVGAIPGLTATLAIALLLPLTFHLSPAAAIVMMTGIFTGGIYGGSIAAITIRVPGAPASAMTMLDGHAMARAGRPATAIGLATFSSFVGGVMGGVALLLFAPQLARAALSFGSPEMFSLVVVALVAVASVSPGALVKGVAATVIGLMLSTVGIDHLVPAPRFTFGSVNLLVGVPIIPVVIGLFAVAEVLHQLDERGDASGGSVVSGASGTDERSDAPEPAPTRLPVHREDAARAWWSEARRVGWATFAKSALIGTLVGALPGAGAAMAAFLAYSEAKRTSRTPERFGTGAPEGIVAPETANNAMTGGAFIPMLAFGIPGDAVTAVILGGLVIHGITPGPQLFTESGELVRPLLVAYFSSYVLILTLGLLLLPVFARISRLPRDLLFPFIATLSIVAAYVSERTVFAMVLTLSVGLAGYLLRRFGYPVIPVLLGLILGPMLETNFRRALILSEGDVTVFFRSPISLVLLVIAALFPVYASRAGRRRRSKI